MAIQRTTKTGSKPTRASAAKVPAKPRAPRPATATVPATVARAAKDVEIRLVERAEEAVADTAQTARIYRASERDGADTLQALVSSYGQLFEGAEEIHERIWEIAQHSLGSVLALPYEFAQCRSFTEIAEKQRDVVISLFGSWMSASHTLLLASRRITDRAIRPLEAQLVAI